MGMIMVGLWVIGFVVSLACFVTNMIDYKKEQKTKEAVITSGIISLVLGLPIVLVVLLIMSLSTGVAGM